MKPLAFLLALACAGAVPPEPAMPDPEIEARLAALSNRVPARDFEAAIPWFTAHAEDAAPLLVAALAEDGPRSARAADCLGRLGRAEAVPALAAALASPYIMTRSAAGLALARVPGPEALAALARAVAEGEPRVAIAAADGLGARAGDPGVCDALRPGLGHVDAGVRFHAEKAAAARGC